MPNESAAATLARRELARRNFRDFVPFVRPGYDMRWFHRVIADELQKVYERKTRKLMIFVPPQHGKSELATRSFPAWVQGKNPNEKIAIVSYSAGIASKFNRDIKRRVDTKLYANLFPGTRLSDGRDGYTKNNIEFEIVGAEGYTYSVGVEGALTSKTVDLGIIDDPVKDRQDAQSPTIQQNTYDFYTDVFQTRLHNDSAQVIIQTRWNLYDLSGRLLERDGIYSKDNTDGWVVIKFPGLRTKEINSYDPRKEGEALWPEKHSQHTLERVKAKEAVTFDALYQQDPKPNKEALVFPDWNECESMPPYIEKFIRGLDFGFNHPSTLVDIGIVGKRLYLDERFYETKLTNSDIGKLITLSGRSETPIYADSAEPKSIAELRVLKHFILPMVKGPDSIRAGINKLNEYEVYYTKRSKNIKREVTNYQWIMIGGVPSNTPIDAYNHTIDAVRGAIYTAYGRPNRELIPDNT